MFLTTHVRESVSREYVLESRVMHTFSKVIVIFMLLSSVYKSYIWENSVFQHSGCLVSL